MFSACLPAIYDSVPNTFASGGTEQAGVTTKEACLDACTKNTACVGADVDSNTGASLCWLHLDSANLGNTGSRTGVEHLILRDRCPLTAGKISNPHTKLTIRWNYKNTDIQYIRANISDIEYLSPRLFGPSTYAGDNTIRGKKTGAFNIYGDYPDFFKILSIKKEPNP